MPHLVLEYSANVPDDPDPDRVLLRLHEALTKPGPFDLANVKSRVVRHERFRVAEGAPGRAFVHLTVSVLAGREAAVLRETGESLVTVLRESFPVAAAERSCDFTVELREMRGDLYFKAGG
ncbi:MAG TPA: 5-carboxymethyl-2-hydroxymuconate Delta-isomerase [Vicinamibacteria bacterium]|nr:5-carboxymethyl-2-hydroxymuconate Delta-isomerase [Vicinamibacteria bacterium]